jgi:hypothetical protein
MITELRKIKICSRVQRISITANNRRKTNICHCFFISRFTFIDIETLV